MDVKLKSDFLAALRSGDYKQITGQLEKPGEGFCCLGVFCKVAGLKIDPDAGNDVIIDDVLVDYQPIYDLLGTDKADLLWRMNDCQKKSFVQIADWAEVNL